MLDVLSAESLRTKDELKSAQVLQRLGQEHLRRQKQVYIGFCGDGKHARDLTTYHATLCAIDPNDDLFHKFAWNGGALILDPQCPLAWLEGAAHDRAALINFEFALILKGHSGDIALYTHGPCGAAGLFGMTFLDVIEAGLRAKYRLRRIFHPAVFDGKVSSYTHTCVLESTGPARKSYFISKLRWEWWLERPGNEERSDKWFEFKDAMKRDPGYEPVTLSALLERPDLKPELIERIRREPERSPSEHVRSLLARH